MPVPSIPPAIIQQATLPTGRAVLRDEQSRIVGSLTETCGGTADRILVTLVAPYTLKGTARLEIHVSTTSDAAVRVSGQGGTVIALGFGGRSRVGCIPIGAPVTLDSTPGGLLGGLLVLIAKGTMTPYR